MSPEPPMHPEPPTLPLQVEAAHEAEAGHYANLTTAWATDVDVALDFAVLLPSELIDTEDGEAVLPRARLVSRVRMPPSQARELVHQITQALQQQAARPRREPGERPSSLWTV